MNLTDKNKIMVIGGDSNFCYLMQRYASRCFLPAMSAHLIISGNLGKDALVLAQRERPSLIVLEVAPPGIMGWNTLHLLKQNPTTRNIPVMICSWLDEEEKGLKAGADIYLRMPILYEDFETALHKIPVFPGASAGDDVRC
jgi:CheY-like chemotaxis protein